MCTFFNQSSQRTDILDEIVGKRLSSGSSSRWNCNLRSVVTVPQNIESLIECFKKIEETTFQTWTSKKAQGLQLKLQQPEFEYWLKFFLHVMPQVDIIVMRSLFLFNLFKLTIFYFYFYYTIVV